MWIVVTLIGGVVGIVIEILLTPMENSGIQKACAIAGFFIGIVVAVFCLYSPMNMKNFSKVYPICTIEDNQYITEKNDGYVSVLCKDYRGKTAIDFPNNIVSYKETDKTPLVKIEGINYKIMPPLAKQEEECDKYTKVTIYVPSDEEKQTEIKYKECGTSNSADSAYCKKCGQSLNATKKCANCGTENSSNAKYCEQCGEKFNDTQD